MSPVDKELLRLVRKVRDRLHAISIINNMILGAAAALCLGMAMAIAARFIPIYNVYLNILKTVGAAITAAFLYSSFRTPGDAYAALKADSFGLEERIITALELAGDQSAFAVLEKNDALEHLRNMDYKKKIPLRLNRKYLLICMILTAAIAVSGFIPNPTAERAEELHRIKSEAAEQQKKAGRLIEKVRSNPKLSEEQKAELEEKLSELRRELKNAKDGKEIEKALGRAEKKLEYIRDKYASDGDLDRIIDTLSKNEMTKALANMIKNGDEKAFRDSIRKMAEELKNLTSEEKQKLAGEISKLAQEIKSNPELSEAFKGLAEKIASGELGDISGELSELDRSISELMENESIRNAVSELQRELGNANAGREAQDSGGHLGQGNTQGGNGQQGQGSQPEGSGQGAGQGSGAGGGTDMGKEHQSPIPSENSGIGKKGGSEKKSEEYEKIFTPDTLGGEGDASNLSGKKGTGGTAGQVITDKGPTVRGNSVPYNQAVGQYKDRAMESMNTSDIPPGMKEMIKEYFTSLEE